MPLVHRLPTDRLFSRQPGIVSPGDSAKKPQIPYLPLLVSHYKYTDWPLSRGLLFIGYLGYHAHLATVSAEAGRQAGLPHSAFQLSP